MIETTPQKNLLSGRGVLRQLNNWLEGCVTRSLQPDQKARVELSIESTRGDLRDPIIDSVAKRTKALLSEADPAQADDHIIHVDKLFLGRKVLGGVGHFQSEVFARLANIQNPVLSQEQEITQLVNSLDSLKIKGERRPFLSRLWSNLSDCSREAGITVKLLLMKAGVGAAEQGNTYSKSSPTTSQVESFSPLVAKVLSAEAVQKWARRAGTLERLEGRVINKIGSFLLDYPVKRQIYADIETTISGETSEAEKQNLRNELLNRYRLSELEARVFSHPDFISRLSTSLAMNRTYYEGARQFFGWAAFASLVKVPFVDLKMPYTVDFFKQVIDRHGLSTITAVSCGVLGSLMIARMGVDYWVLKKHDMTPDVVELFFALSSGRVDNDSRLRANPRFGLIGAPIDVLVSSTMPPWSAAWVVDAPYSVPAYILAMAVDQITFMAGNLAYSTVSKFRKTK